MDQNDLLQFVPREVQVNRIITLAIEMNCVIMRLLKINI